MKVLHDSKGFSVLEVLIATSIILILTTAIAQAWRSHIILTHVNTQRTQIALILEETSDTVEYLRDKSWDTYIAPLTLNTPYYLTWTGSTYEATTTRPVSQAYTRTITFSSITRDGNDSITTSSGTLDTRSRKVTLSVSLTGSQGVVSEQAEMLIHDTYDN